MTVSVAKGPKKNLRIRPNLVRILNFGVKLLTYRRKSPNFNHLLSFSSVFRKISVKLKHFFLFSKDGSLHDYLQVTSSDIWLEIFNYSKNPRWSKFGIMSKGIPNVDHCGSLVTCLNFDHYIYFSPCDRNNVRQTTVETKKT